jgi:uncharacterized protein YdhG (YjbR/CyaY superfamily)
MEGARGKKPKSTGRCHICGAVDEYILSQHKQVQPLLQKIRMALYSAAPAAIEKISYKMPALWVPASGGKGKTLVHFAAFACHIGFYPGSEAIQAFADRLEGYETAKGTIHFPLDGPIDCGLIEDIVRWKVQSTESRVAKRKQR